MYEVQIDFSQLPGIMLERYRAIVAKYQCVPAASDRGRGAGTQAIQLIQANYPDLPVVMAKPAGKSKLVDRKELRR